MYNRRADRALSSQDVASRLVLSASWEVPVGRGRRFFSQAPGIADAVLGGWQINALATMQSGLPIPIYQSFNNTGLGNAAQRPNNNGHSAQIEGGTKDERLLKWFDTSVFSIAPAFTFGNSPRVLPDVRHPGVRNVDLSLFKTFRLAGEKLRAQFRAEAFNAFNTPQFGRAASTIGAPVAGIIDSVAVAPRELQLALKLIF